jgi:hypothetical protein
MPIFQVRLQSGGEYQQIEMARAKEAAEKLHGRELSKVGSLHEVRVLVHEMRWPRRPSPILFYDRG